MRTILVVMLIAATGCKEKPRHQAPPANAGSAGAAPDLMLPRSDGTPPKKTTKPLTKDDYDRLAKLSFPGFEGTSRDLRDNAFEIRQLTKDRPKLEVIITIQPCFDCVPMELEKWKSRTEDLKVYLGPLKDQPGVDFEVGETKLRDTPIMYTYQVGAANAPGVGGGAYSFTNGFIAYYNDGVNQIRVLGQYKDDPQPKEKLMEIAPKGDLQALALSFLDVYTHAWVK